MTDNHGFHAVGGAALEVGRGDSQQIVNKRMRQAAKKKLNKSKNTNVTRNDELEQVVVPMLAIGKFLSLAQPNTDCKIETCGFLAGKYTHGQFSVSHILVPKQHGFRDNCVTYGEEEILHFNEQKETMILGWIHTHPTQTQFLSSLDLHTQYSFEAQFSASLAVVCSPQNNDVGFYCLTDYGRDVLRGCKEKGFHKHPEDDDLYRSNPQHLVMGDHDVDIVDLRY